MCTNDFFQVPFETRHLNVGDFGWIAKEIVAFNPNVLRQRAPRELVLPYIVERKRMDDLKSSIIDGRYVISSLKSNNIRMEFIFI